MRKACVIGTPIKHSRSPLIHRYWLSTMGIAGDYERCEVAPPNLPEFFTQLRNDSYIGCNVTLPHKEVVARLVDKLDETARLTGSVNTIYKRNNELHATSTDGEGFIGNINWRHPKFTFQAANVMLLGAGGSARAIVHALLMSGVDAITIANRTVSKAQTLADEFGSRVKTIGHENLAAAAPQIDLLINTTSAGIADDQALIFPFDRLNRHSLVTDINYVPLHTPFLQQATQTGLTTIGGLGMLLHQAVRGFELWFGQHPMVTEELYALVARDIDPSYAP